MKRFKLFVWILVLFIIEFTIINRIAFFNSAPDLVFAFAVAYAMLEEEYEYAVGAAIICGICTGSICSGSFSVSVLMYSYGAIIVKALENKLRYIPDFAKALFWTFVMSALGEAIMYFTLNLSFDPITLWRVILPFSLCNTAAEAILYPIVKKTMVVFDAKKKLIPD